MKKVAFAIAFVFVSGSFVVSPGFAPPANAARCDIAKAPEGLKRKSYVRTIRKGKNKGFKYQLSDRPGWIYILDPKKGWVVTKCFR